MASDKAMDDKLTDRKVEDCYTCKHLATRANQPPCTRCHFMSLYEAQEAPKVGILIALREMDKEIKIKRREWEAQGDREDQVERSSYLDGFAFAMAIATQVHHNEQESPKAALKDGKPCDHPGCLSHVTHPCEGCGRIGGRSAPKAESQNVSLWEIIEKIDENLVSVDWGEDGAPFAILDKLEAHKLLEADRAAQRQAGRDEAEKEYMLKGWDNHHNAATCPHCNHGLKHTWAEYETMAKRYAAVVEAANVAKRFLESGDCNKGVYQREVLAAIDKALADLEAKPDAGKGDDTQ